MKNTLLVCSAFLCQAAFGIAASTVHLSGDTSPSSGVAGINNVNITATGVPAGTITPANVIVTFATTCGGAAVATASADSVTKIIGSADRFNVFLPGTLAAGAYDVQISDIAAGDANFISGSSCSQVVVQHTSAALSCAPSSSLGVLAPGSAGPVVAYVPNGSWGGGSTGVSAVAVEGAVTGLPAVIPTAGVVNSCASNAATGETVCVDNNTGVYLITGHAVNATLTSGSDNTASFSGGFCENCGVAMDQLNNRAVIAIGLTASDSGSGIQLLNLTTNTFGTPFPAEFEVSENQQFDQTRNLILSADEEGDYDLFQIQSDGVTIREFNWALPDALTGTLDASAEDCSTGIALASDEFTNSVFITDLIQGQAAFASGSPAGTWSAPATLFTMTSSYTFSDGTDGIAVAPGTSHLAVVTGEFGGNTFAVLQLPSTAGSGTPTILDYAVAQIPSSTACGGAFSAGFDPHTVSAYTSPNTGKAIAVFANGTPSCVVTVDMGAILAAPRGGSGLLAHDVSAANAASAFTFFGL